MIYNFKTTWIIVVVLILLLVLLLFYFYFFETKRIKVKNYKYENKKISPLVNEQIKGIKIVFFSDLHVGKLLKKKELLERLKYIRSLNADIYLFGGDLIGKVPNEHFTPADIKECFSIFDNSLNLMVYGNHEFKEEKGITPQEKLDLFHAISNFKLLVDESYVYEKGSTKIVFTGLNEAWYNEYKLPKLNEEDNNIILIHQGDTFNDLNCGNLVLSGHTHGGQVKFPFFRPPYTPRLGKKYLKGLYTKDNRHLIVSLGVGCNILKLRLFAPADVICLDFRD